jgi:acyl carrier protein
MSREEDFYKSVTLAVSSACGLEPTAISADTVLAAIGFDSMALVYVVTQIGFEHGQAVPLDRALDLFRAKTVGALSAELQKIVVTPEDVS